MSKRYVIPRLDLMVAYSCNLSCVGCISISDRRRQGVEPMQSLLISLSQWRERISPQVVSLFGGEPCLHPNLIDICEAVRETWPLSIIRLITNGYLIDRFRSEKWFDFSPFEIQVSVHRKDHESIINKQIKNILLAKTGWKVKKISGVRNHKQIEWSIPDFKIYKSIFADFIVPYKDNTGEIEPWHSDPADSHQICGSPSTPILYKNRMYKCTAVANAIDLVGLNWYGYTGFGPDDDLEKFVAEIGKPEPICGQCPDRQNAVIIDHFNKRNVIVKSHYLD